MFKLNWFLSKIKMSYKICHCIEIVFDTFFNFIVRKNLQSTDAKCFIVTRNQLKKSTLQEVRRNKLYEQYSLQSLSKILQIDEQTLKMIKKLRKKFSNLKILQNNLKKAEIQKW